MIAVIAVLAGLLMLALLMRIGQRHVEGSVLIAWRHDFSCFGVLVFLSAALLLKLHGPAGNSTNRLE